jgi:hypothetical protein
MVALSDIARWCYKNPGIIDPVRLSEETGYDRRTCGAALANLCALQPRICERVGRGVYLIRPPELVPEPEASMSAPTSAPEPAQLPFDNHDGEFTEIIPDDEDLYPPFKILIYDHWRSKRGETWYRVKDEHGKRGVFRWIDDE